MEREFIKQEMAQILTEIAESRGLGQHVDAGLQCPEPHRGTGDIRLIILGQDPTVKNELSRKNIKMVLNLDKSGSLTHYLKHIAESLGLTVKENVYATNIVKNFFTIPPTQFEDNCILSGCAEIWRPLLLKELEMFPSAPIISLGEPVLTLLASGKASKRVREYWGFQKSQAPAKIDEFRCLLPEDNILGRLVFPFPHQPSIRKTFYKETLPSYLQFVRNKCSSTKS